MKLKPMDITHDERIFLSNLRTRPGLYLGNDVILTAFSHLIGGMELMPHIHGEYRKYCIIPDGFNEFVAMHYLGHAETARNWTSLIQIHEINDHTAFEKFWELLDEYLISLGYEPIPYQPKKTVEYKHSDGINSIKYSELPEIADSYIRTFNGAPWHDDWTQKTAFDRFKEMYYTPGFWGLSIWKDNKPFGAVLGRCETYFDGDYFQIVEFWIEPSEQKKGYGRKLLDEVKRILKFRKVKKIYLITMHGNETEGFYKHNGFTTDEGLCIMNLLTENPPDCDD